MQVYVTDGAQSAGKTLEHCGGGLVLEIAADLIGEVINDL